MTRSIFRTARRGFTLVEVLACIVILGILGAALTKLRVAQSRLYELQRAKRDARSAGRASMNLLFSDLRMVHDGADAPGSVMLASPESLSLRVPYAMGLVCGNSSGATTVSMFPVDSAVKAMAKYAGYAWRSRLTKQYTYVAVLDTVGNSPVTGAAMTKRSRTRVLPSASIVSRNGPRATRAVSTSSTFGRIR